MPDYVYLPQITNATITPNQVATKQAFIISVTIIEQQIDLADFTAKSGDVYSGEI